MFTLRAQKVLIKRVCMKYLQLQGTQEKWQVKLKLKQLTVYIFCNNKDRSREKNCTEETLLVYGFTDNKPIFSPFIDWQSCSVLLCKNVDSG